MTLSLWLSFAGLCSLGAVSPGPSLAVVLRHTVSSSPRHGAAVALAHAAGVGLWAAVTLTGLGALFSQLPLFQRGISGLGGIYLFSLGWRALRSAANAPAGERAEAAPVAAAATRARSLWSSAREGFMISMLNPKLALFFLALFSQLITPALRPFDLAVIVGTAAGIDGLWYLAVATLLARGPILSWLRAHIRQLDRLTGVVLLLFSLRLLIPLGLELL